MRTVLSLALRPHSILGAILASISPPALATELQFDLTGNVCGSFDCFNGHPTGPPVDVSFMFNTRSGTPSYVFGVEQSTGPAPILDSFSVAGATLTDVNVLLNGQSVLTADRLRPTSLEGVATIGRLSFGVGSTSVVWTFDPFPIRTEAAFLAPSDPLASFLLSVQTSVHPNFDPFFGVLITPSNGVQDWVVSDVVIEPEESKGVPEPGTLGLLVLGFASVVLCRSKKIAAWRRDLSSAVPR